MEIKETVINNPDGTVRINKTPKITGKGQTYFVNKFLNPKEGIMEIKETVINNPDGTVRINKTPKITGKGQTYFVNKFLNPKEM